MLICLGYETIFHTLLVPIAAPLKVHASEVM
jgi:hypothetical protein